ncbi:hypothetical protein L596_002972 [Steinernema carpocapsae]|uniref:ADP-ribose pyrophosphatase, mitochondrial n=1 Tax=Steinernema carpocapsae TaxID=34508 RepID=A0A4U8UR40_STECR|nr:hypothetical protein L596_002972 [Steinernema carpocapsae]
MIQRFHCSDKNRELAWISSRSEKNDVSKDGMLPSSRCAVDRKSGAWVSEFAPLALQEICLRAPSMFNCSGLCTLRSISAMQGAGFHWKCRQTEKPYLYSDVCRVNVPDDKVRWSATWPEYSPPDYTSKDAKNKSWADGDDLAEIKFNEVDGDVDRRSHKGAYEIGTHGRPLNPEGRCGLMGRGLLGRWGPNHAADPIVSRFHKGQLQFIAIQRGDIGNVNALQLADLWTSGKELFKGYVDDPRNTDNAWMETIVVNFHDDRGLLDTVKFKAGDDAVNVGWVDVKSDIPLYASHESFIRLLAERF